MAEVQDESKYLSATVRDLRAPESSITPAAQALWKAAHDRSGVVVSQANDDAKEKLSHVRSRALAGRHSSILFNQYRSLYNNSMPRRLSSIVQYHLAHVNGLKKLNWKRPVWAKMKKCLGIAIRQLKTCNIPFMNRLSVATLAAVVEALNHPLYTCLESPDNWSVAEYTHPMVERAAELGGTKSEKEVSLIILCVRAATTGGNGQAIESFEEGSGAMIDSIPEHLRGPLLNYLDDLEWPEAESIGDAMELAIHLGVHDLGAGLALVAGVVEIVRVLQKLDIGEPLNHDSNNLRANFELLKLWSGEWSCVENDVQGVARELCHYVKEGARRKRPAPEDDVESFGSDSEEDTPTTAGAATPSQPEVGSASGHSRGGRSGRVKVEAKMRRIETPENSDDDEERIIY